MAAAARPGPADARVPCPLCGGLIHPIAGRCKHCKGDLREYRSTRPAAGATLPALNQPGPAPHVNGHAGHAGHAGHVNGHAGHAGGSAGNGHVNGHGPAKNGYHAPLAQQQQQSLAQAFAAAAPIPLAVGPGPGPGPGPAEAVPILPPRPTGHYAAPAPRASWKSWPVIVIVLAVIAIVTAVVLMLFPPGGAAAQDEGTNHSLQPAPDRMDTNPTPAPATPRQPPSTDKDPWSRGGGGTAPTKPPSAQAPPDDPDIDDPDVDDALTSRDPFSRRGGGAGGLGGMGGLGSPRVGMLYAIIKQACTRLSSCNATSAQTKALCDIYARVPAATPSCTAATRCLRSIEDLSCDALGNDASSLWQLKDKLDDCADAMSC